MVSRSIMQEAIAMEQRDSGAHIVLRGQPDVRAKTRFDQLSS